MRTKQLHRQGGDVVVVASLNLRNDLPINAECMFHRTNPSCSMSLEADNMTFNYFTTVCFWKWADCEFIDAISGLTHSSLVRVKVCITVRRGFHWFSGRSQDSYAISQTTRGTLVSDFYGIAQDDSDPSTANTTKPTKYALGYLNFFLESPGRVHWYQWGIQTLPDRRQEVLQNQPGTWTPNSGKLGLLKINQGGFMNTTKLCWVV